MDQEFSINDYDRDSGAEQEKYNLYRMEEKPVLGLTSSNLSVIKALNSTIF